MDRCELLLVGDARVASSLDHQLHPINQTQSNQSAYNPSRSSVGCLAIATKDSRTCLDDGHVVASSSFVQGSITGKVLRVAIGTSIKQHTQRIYARKHKPNQPLDDGPGSSSSSSSSWGPYQHGRPGRCNAAACCPSHPWATRRASCTPQRYAPSGPRCPSWRSREASGLQPFIKATSTNIEIFVSRRVCD